MTTQSVLPIVELSREEIKALQTAIAQEICRLHESELPDNYIERSVMNLESAQEKLETALHA